MRFILENDDNIKSNKFSHKVRTCYDRVRHIVYHRTVRFEIGTTLHDTRPPLRPPPPNRVAAQRVLWRAPRLRVGFHKTVQLFYLIPRDTKCDCIIISENAANHEKNHQLACSYMPCRFFHAAATHKLDRRKIDVAKNFVVLIRSPAFLLRISYISIEYFHMIKINYGTCTYILFTLDLNKLREFIFVFGLL